MDLETTTQKIVLPYINIVQEPQTPNQEYIAKFNRLLHTYKDEIPDKIVHSTSEDSRYKCRAGWWGQITLGVSSLIGKNVLSEFTVDYYHQVMEDYWISKRKTGLTSKQNIENANKLIYLVLSDLEKDSMKF
jgi:hypothetical protein